MTTITNADREAALAFLTSDDWLGAFSHRAEIDTTAKAFARHREQALEEAAAMLDELANKAMYEREYTALDGAAKRLRALIGETK